MSDDNVVNLEELRKKIEENKQSSSEYLANDPFLFKMNQNHAFVHSIGGKPMVSSYVYSEIFDRNVLEFVTPDSIKVRYCNQTVKVGKNDMELGRWWISHAERKQYNTIIFDPSKPKEYNNCLNLWEGFSVKPTHKPNGWKLTLKHIYNILCNKEPLKFKYVIRWLAWCVQNPEKRAEISIIFKGKQGAGKGFLFTYFSKIFGQHSMCVANRELLTGKHNGHFSKIVFLFADEAYYPGDKEVEGVMKQLITEPSIAYRAMYKDAVMGANRLHIVQSTNSEWVIPAGDDTRRYFINAVDNKYAKGQISDLERNLYFSSRFAELNNGGCEAMLYDLLNMDLYGWHPRTDIPNTEELGRQIKFSRTKLQAVIFNILEDAIFPGSLINTEYVVAASDLYYYIDSLDNTLRAISSIKKADFIKSLGAKKKRMTKGVVWIFPTLKEIRNNWDKLYGKEQWDKNIKEWQIIKSEF